MIPKVKINLLKFSIATIWIFHIIGIIGILYLDFKWFLSATPINISISFILLLVNCRKTSKFLNIVFLTFFVGIVAEVIGVNYGLIFGNYSYGEALGYKIYGVPILIAANWTIVTICSASISSQFSKNFWIKIFTGIGLMLLLDLLIEPIAPILDFWEFDDGFATIQNYIGWLLVSLPLHFFFHYWKVAINSYFTHHLFLLQLIFFMTLTLKL